MARRDGKGARRAQVWPGAAAALVLFVGFLVVIGGAGPTSTTTTAPPPMVEQTSPTSTVAASPQGSVVAEAAMLAAAPPGWARLPAGPLASRTGQSAVWTGHEMIVWGGRAILEDRSGGGVFTPSQDAARDAWWPMAPAPIVGGVAPATAWTGDELFVFGGAAAMFDPSRDRWRSVAYPHVTPSHPLAAVWTGDEIILIGYRLHPPEVEGSLFATAYGARGECCRRLPDPPVELSYARAAWTGEQLLVLGGAAATGDDPAEPRFAAYEPARDAWSALEPPPLDAGRELSAVWTGEELVAVDRLLRAAAWQPGRGWRQLPDAPFDFAGCFPQAVAADHRVFVWYCRQSAVLDTATDTWISIATPQLDPHALSTSCVPVAATDTILLWCGNDPADPFFWQIDPDAVVAADP